MCGQEESLLLGGEPPQTSIYGLGCRKQWALWVTCDLPARAIEGTFQILVTQFLKHIDCSVEFPACPILAPAPGQQTTVHSLMQEESTHARHQRQPEWPVTTMPEYKMDKFWSWIDFCQHDIWAWSGNGAGRWDDLSQKVVLAAQSSLGWFVLQWNYQINFCRLELRPIGGGQDRLASSSQLLLQQLFNPRHHLSTTPHPSPSRSAARNTDNWGPKIVHL